MHQVRRRKVKLAPPNERGFFFSEILLSAPTRRCEATGRGLATRTVSAAQMTYPINDRPLAWFRVA
jgi:hypothetical protein